MGSLELGGPLAERPRAWGPRPQPPKTTLLHSLRKPQRVPIKISFSLTGEIKRKEMHEIYGSETIRRLPAQLGFTQIPKSSGSQITVCEPGLASKVSTRVTRTEIKKQNMACTSEAPSILLFSHHPALSTSTLRPLTASFRNLCKWNHAVVSFLCLPSLTQMMFERLTPFVQWSAVWFALTAVRK